MEVFMQNLPLDLSYRNLQQHLTPLIERLHIKDWSCRKVRKRKFGSVTFLRQTDGQQFLARYGRKPKPSLFPKSEPQFRSCMRILNHDVYCLESKYPPDHLLLKALTKSAEDRREAEQYPPSPDETAIIFDTQSVSCGFYHYINNELTYSPEVEWLSATGTAKFAKKALIIDFKDGVSDYRIEIPNQIVEAIVATSRPTALTLTLWETPHFFGISQTTRTKNRLTGLPSHGSSHQKVIGQALIYHICVSPVEFYKLSDQLIQREVLTVIRHNLLVVRTDARTSLIKGFEVLNEDIKQISTYPDLLSHMFPVLFQMEALARNGFLPPQTVQQLLTKLLLKMEKQRQGLGSSSSKQYTTKIPISAEAVRKLLSQIPFPSIEVDASVFSVDEIWRYLEQNEEEIQRGFHKELITERGRENLTIIHKVNVTPTGLTLQGPDPEAKNRVLRRFPNHTEYFIRVQFCDEDGSDLRFNSRVSNEEIYERFRDVMHTGIKICGRVYGFLGFSHSSLRSHSAWFMAPFVCDGKVESYLTVINYLGRFDKIHSPARCAARIGQAFSETPFAISLREHGMRHGTLSDIKSPDGSHVFSDGVGTLSRAVVEAIRVTILRKKGAATCFQIRWGGAKGMLALDTRLDGSMMYVRNSMVKFASKDIENLEICDAADKPIPLVLNRQMIKILEDMGLSKSWFLKEQTAALIKLQLVTAHISNTAGFLKRQNIADRVGFPQLIRQLGSFGVDYKRDHFMRSVVETAVLRELRLMKHKARIPIEHGVTLFGIMDETGYLQEDEVFITFDDASFIGCQALGLDNRRMLITRSPALHPGDIQFATNIIPPEHHPLRALRNCIVFSQRGIRDLPSCLSGGDLDGDIYGIIWDKDAVDGCQEPFYPAEYPRAEPLDIGRTVERKDMTDFFIKFMATDQLGLIATRHMILADQRSAGTDDPDCKTLAELHSTGVDYSKTGIPVEMEIFKSIKSNRYRPHFLAPSQPVYLKNSTEIDFDTPTRPRKDEEEDEDENAGPQYLYYRSEKINGILFDAIDEKKIWYQNVKGMGKTDGEVWSELLRHIKHKCDTILGGIRWAHLKEEAYDIRHAYEDAIYNATVDYSVHPTQRLTELEVFTGSIFNGSGVQTRRQRDRSFQLADEWDRIARWAENMIRRRTANATAGRDEEGEAVEDPDSALALSIACLEASQWSETRSNRLRMGRSVEEFQSFKIIAACCAIRELDATIRRAGVEE